MTPFARAAASPAATAAGAIAPAAGRKPYLITPEVLQHALGKLRIRGNQETLLQNTHDPKQKRIMMCSLVDRNQDAVVKAREGDDSLSAKVRKMQHWSKKNFTNHSFGVRIPILRKSIFS